jgi:alpha-D-ribose 1-methylphosphonate 5-triphosphate diphosphatase
VERTIRSRRVLAGGELREASVAIAGGEICEVSANGGSACFDAGSLLILPGIVDLHGDAFEGQIMPRPKVFFPPDMALRETDQQMVANGITTAYHGLTVNWEPGRRDIHAARAFLQSLERVGPGLACDTRVHLRHEVLSLDTADEVSGWIADGRIGMVGFNDHSVLVERSLADSRVSKEAERAGLPAEEYAAMFRRMAARRDEVAPTVERMAKLAGERGVPMCSHDDETPEMRRFYRGLKCHICEFPANRETAEEARGHGEPVVMGAPNVVRGASHCRRMTASEAIGERLCTVLSSDYYYPSILHAPFRLAAAGVVPFAEAWGLVSANPARAAGLNDRGEIAAGRRADLVLVDDSDSGLPRVAAVFVKGRPVYAAAGAHGLIPA